MMRTVRVLVTALILAFFSPVLAAEVVDAGMPAPEWEMSDSEGREIAFPAVTQGRPGILFFWASWCPYCHVVMPYLQGIVEDYAEHGLQVFAINFKDDGDPVAYMEEHGYDFVVLPLGDLVADDYGVISSPGLLVVDGEGMVTYRRRPTRAPPGMAIAEVWDQQLREALDRILNRPADE
jgi:cytochrome c biogenesis protein CcmG/thiol:disulfide interchange protein DsbE